MTARNQRLKWGACNKQHLVWRGQRMSHLQKQGRGGRLSPLGPTAAPPCSQPQENLTCTGAGAEPVWRSQPSHSGDQVHEKQIQQTSEE